MREPVFLCFDILTEYVYILSIIENVMHYAVVDESEKKGYDSYFYIHASFYSI